MGGKKAGGIFIFVFLILFFSLFVANYTFSQGYCNLDSGCNSPIRVCSEHSCVSIGCEVSTDCASSGRFCASNGYCRSRTCNDNSDCASPAVCSLGMCLVTETRNHEGSCGSGYACDGVTKCRSTSTNQYLTEKICASDRWCNSRFLSCVGRSRDGIACNSDRECISNICSRGYCASSSSDWNTGCCPGFTCSIDDRRCVSGSRATKTCASGYHCDDVDGEASCVVDAIGVFQVRTYTPEEESSEESESPPQYSDGSREDGELCTENVDCLSGLCMIITSELYPSRDQNPFGGDRICVSNENSFGECGSGYQCGGTNSDRCVNPRGGEDHICRSDSYCGQISNGNYACIYEKPNGASCSQGYECESNSCSGAGTCTVDTRTGTGIPSAGGGGITTVGGTDTTSKTTTEDDSASSKGINTNTCEPDYYWHILDSEDSRAGSSGVQTFVQAGRRVRAYATCIRDRAGEIVPDGREVTFTVFEEDGLFGDDDMGSVSSVVDGTVAFVDVVVNYVYEENPFDKTNEYRFDVKCEENKICGGSGNAKLDMIYVREPTARSPAIESEDTVDACTKNSECGAGSTCNTLLSLCVSSDGTVKRETTAGTTLSGDGIVDTDRDGMPDEWETEHGLNPNKPSDAAEDIDRDGLTNLEEYQRGTSPRLRDTDRDGILDRDEEVPVTDTTVVDTDGDGMPDSWETEHGLNPNKPSDASLDADNDGLTNLEEFQRSTNPRSRDTDRDGIPDADEEVPGAAAVDTDGDGMPDSWETEHGLDLNDPNDTGLDADSDGLTNAEEYNNNSDPNNSDSDSDGILDGNDDTPAGEDVAADGGFAGGDTGSGGGDGGGGGSGGGGGGSTSYCQLCASNSDCSGSTNNDGECCGVSAICTENYLSSVYGSTDEFQNSFICADTDFDGLAERYRITCGFGLPCETIDDAISEEDLLYAGVESGYAQEGYCDFTDEEETTAGAEDIPAYSLLGILLSIFVLVIYYNRRRL